MKKPTDQTSLVLYKLITYSKPLTVGDFQGYPRISEYIRRLRKNHNLEIQTIPIKFTTQFGQQSQYASYKLLTEREKAIEVYKNMVTKNVVSLHQ